LITQSSQYLAYDPLPDVVSFLGLNSTATPKTTAKALYALSGLLQHNGPAVAAFGRPDVNGWPRLRESLRGGFRRDQFVARLNENYRR
jgi:hypothetical protein